MEYELVLPLRALAARSETYKNTINATKAAPQ